MTSDEAILPARIVATAFPDHGLAGASHSPVVRYSSIDAAALRPAPMARMTVAPPVTMSPPAKTPFFEVRRVSGSAAM